MARHRVLILGGGFGGLYAAKALRDADVPYKVLAGQNAPTVVAPRSSGSGVRGREAAEAALAVQRPFWRRL